MCSLFPALHARAQTSASLASVYNTTTGTMVVLDILLAVSLMFSIPAGQGEEARKKYLLYSDYALDNNNDHTLGSILLVYLFRTQQIEQSIIIANHI